MPATPVLSQRRHRPRPADQLLSQQRRRQPRRHRRHLERERLAGVEAAAASAPTGARVRGIGEPVGLNGKTSGIIPFVRVMDSLTLAISQGSLRRGSAAVYLDVCAPRDRGVPRDPQAVAATSTARRSTSTTACSSPTSSWRRCATAPSSSCAAPRTAPSAARSTPARCSRSWSRPASRPASRTSSSSTR